MVRQGGSILANNLQIFPPPVTLGKEVYPENIPEKIAAAFPDTTLVDGLQLASEAGNPRTVNTVLLGALSKRIDIDDAYWQQTFEKMVPAKYLKENLMAFSLGRNL